MSNGKIKNARYILCISGEFFKISFKVIFTFIYFI